MQRAGMVLLALVLGCGPFDGFPTEEDPPPGRVCYEDADCVPDACCGLGTRAVHREDGPDCSQASCSGQCAANLVDCGCEVPICRNARCATAVREECL